MTPARGVSRTTVCRWSLPFVSIALGGLLLIPGGRSAYFIGVTVAAVVWAGWIAVGDFRTGLLPDRWTGPFALAGMIQVLLDSASVQDWLDIAAPCLIGSTVTASLYLLLGLLGWVGFGDVKFAVGLGLFVAIPGGWTGLYLLPLALVISALAHLLVRIRRRLQHRRAAHGPALAAALAVLMSAACINLA